MRPVIDGIVAKGVGPEGTGQHISGPGYPDSNLIHDRT
jgi:hypothetical protein